MGAKTKTIIARVPESQHSELKEIALKYSVPESQIIRWAIDAIISLEKSQNGIQLPVNFSFVQIAIDELNDLLGCNLQSLNDLTHLVKKTLLDAEEEGGKKSEEPANIEPFLPGNLIDLPFVGSIACGEPVEAVREGEHLTVQGEYDKHHYIGEANGRSNEPNIIDGDKFIFETKDKVSPRHGKLCVIADAHGMSLKRYNKTTKRYESDNEDFADFVPVGDVRLVGYYVETI